MPNLWCALRTFDSHAVEMGGNPLPSPLFFLKPWSALAHPPLGCELSLPEGLGEIHHEVELVLEIDANRTISRIAVGLDLTDRSAQEEAKATGMPWTRSKGFRNSALVGEFTPPPVGLDHLRLEIAVNGEPRQEAAIGEMTFSPLELLENLESWAPLESGDLLFCGTPAGVSAIHGGDHLVARLFSEDGTILSELNLTLA